MNRSFFLRAYSLMLIIALAFGQVGVGFFHNKHDAHETVVDMSHTVLLPHGDHCKVCSTDWLHHFIGSDSRIETTHEQHEIFNKVVLISFLSFSQSRASDRAPPVIA
jgi:hypothetical protein